jgi:hypothetical protein
MTRLASTAGRRLDRPELSIVVALDGISLDLRQRYQDAGVNRLVLPLSAGVQGPWAGETGSEISKQLPRLAATVEQGQKIEPVAAGG